MSFFGLILVFLFASCGQDDNGTEIIDPPESEFLFGADLSSTNQVLDHGGTFTDDGEIRDPYRIFSDHGTEAVRLRIWHSPEWTREVYEEGTQRYNDLDDVARAISSVKDNSMQTLLDFHFSDTWADPGKQHIPEAWREIRDIEVLSDSVYHYTYRTLNQLKNEGLMPEYVQLGNEINCGMFITDIPEGFPSCNVCDGQWENMAIILNSGIQAVRDVAPDTKIILHVADPVNVEWWFGNIIENGVNDFDIIGFSYYPIWHTGVPVGNLSAVVSGFINEFGREVIILETAYPWTSEGNDDYTNLFGSNGVNGYPVTPEGQRSILQAITQQMIDGGGTGIFYWEPAWITSDMRDLWGTGSPWENNAFFDFNGEVNSGMDYMEATYDFNE